MSLEIKAYDPSGNEPSLQQIQSIYHSITGKTESIHRLFFDAHVVHMADFDHLHELIKQTLEQYNCKASNFTGIVRYVDGKTDRFSSFEKLKSFGSSRGYATTEVELEYNFLIQLPQSEEFKPYVIIVGCRNGLGILESFRLLNSTDAEKSMYFEFQRGTARLEIEYVDLAVARSFESCLEEWYRSLKKQSESWIFKYSRKASPVISVAIQVNMFIVAAICLYQVFFWRYENMGEDHIVFRFVVVAFLVFFSLFCVSIPVKNFVEKRLSRVKIQPVIIFTICDSDLYLPYSKGSIQPIWTILMSQLFSIFSGLIVALLVGYIGI